MILSLGLALSRLEMGARGIVRGRNGKKNIRAEGETSLKCLIAVVEKISNFRINGLISWTSLIVSEIKLSQGLCYIQIIND